MVDEKDSAEPHRRAYRSGTFQGDIPDQFLRDNRLVVCRVCRSLVVGSEGTVHPSCSPKDRALNTQPAADPFSQEADADNVARLPSIKAVWESRRNVVLSVPKSCRPLWCKVFMRAIASVLAYNVICGNHCTADDELRCEEAWTELLMLPKATLAQPTRSGKASKRRGGIDSHIRSRLNRWLDGERETLWRDLPHKSSETGAHGRNKSIRDRVERAVELVEEGLDGLACKALFANGTPQVLGLLNSKHPVRPPVSAPNFNSLPFPDDIDRQVVASTLKSFPRLSAGEPSGWKAQLVQDIAFVPGNDQVLVCLTDLCNLLARGHAPTNLQPFLAGAGISALLKEDPDDLRPIAVGELFRRLASKAMCITLKEEARAYLWPLQVGVGSQLACETVVHTISQYMSRKKRGQGQSCPLRGLQERVQHGQSRSTPRGCLVQISAAKPMGFLLLRLSQQTSVPRGFSDLRLRSPARDRYRAFAFCAGHSPTATEAQFQ